MSTKAAAKRPAIPRTARLIKTQYGSGLAQFAGTDEPAYEQHLFDNGLDPSATPARDRFQALARSVRDILSQRWLLTEKTYEGQDSKPLYYVSLKFLIGRSLANKIMNLLPLSHANRSRQHSFVQRRIRISCLAFTLGMLPALALGQDLTARAATPSVEQPAGQQSDLLELTLEQAVELAIANNSSLKTASLETQRAADDLAANRTRRFANTQFLGLGAQLVTKPSVTFPAGSMGTYSATGPIPATNQKIEIARKPAGTVNFDVFQPLSTQYQLHLQLKALALGLEVTRQDQAKTRLEVVDQVRRAYYTVVEAQSALDSIQASLPYYEESHRLALANRGKETILESDLLNADAQLLKIRNAISDATDRVASASENLNDLMGRDIHTQFRVTAVSNADADLTTPEAMEARALQVRPDVKKAKLQVQQADYDARAKKAEYIPDLSLAFNYYTTANFENILPSNIGTVGLSLKWEPWDWGRRRQEYAEKRVKEQQAKVAVGATERGVLLEVRNACRQLENTRRQLALSDANERAAREKLKEVQEQVKRQAALSKDLFQAQSDLASVDSQQQQDLAAFWKARAELKKAIGEE
jgi:outer membrane protein TolC